MVIEPVPITVYCRFLTISNVGKHDVGTLPRKGGLKALKHRQSHNHTHHHTHQHTQQAPQPQFARTYHSDNLSHDQDLD